MSSEIQDAAADFRRFRAQRIVVEIITEPGETYEGSASMAERMIREQLLERNIPSRAIQTSVTVNPKAEGIIAMVHVVGAPPTAN